jgi:hypothetical protein
MVHYLRNSQGRTIIECETSEKDLSSSVYIQEYSRMLLNLSEANRSYAKSFLDEISDLDGIRGSWWEMEEDSGKWKSIDDFVAHQFKEVSSKWGLNYVTD